MEALPAPIKRPLRLPGREAGSGASTVQPRAWFYIPSARVG